MDNKPTFYHVSWLEIALKNFKEQMVEVHSINSNMTIDEFIKTWTKDELNKIIKL